MPPPIRLLLGLVLPALALVSACAAPEAEKAATRPATSAATTTQARSTPPGLAARPTCPRVDLKAKPATTLKNALSALESAGSSTYRVQSEARFPEGHITTSRSVRVDEQQERAEYTASIGTKGVPNVPTTEKLTVVVAGDEAYVTAASWTGSKEGKWMRLTEARAGTTIVPFEVAGVDTVPDEIADLVPDAVEERYGRIFVHGRIPALAAVSALGLRNLILSDPALARSLRGNAEVTLRLDNNQCLEFVEILGWESRITGSPKKVSAKAFDALIRSSVARIDVSSVGVPQRIDVPDSKSLVTVADA